MSMLGSKCCCREKCSRKNYFIGIEDCYNAESGGQGIDRRKFNFDTPAGKVYLIYDAYSVPDKFTVFIDGEEINTTGYVGDPFYAGEIEVVGPGKGCLLINKPFGVTEIEIEVEAPLSGTGWEYRLSCLITDEREPREFIHFVGNNGGRVDFTITLLNNLNDAIICGNVSDSQTVSVEIFDYNNLDNLLFRQPIFLGDSAISKSKSFYKPSGITDLLIRISYLDYGLDITSIELSIGCPQPSEDETECTADEFIGSSDEKTGPIEDDPNECRSESGDDISEDANENDFIVPRPSIGENPRDITQPLLPPPPSEGYFPPEIINRCTTRNLTNTNEPFCYNLNIFGYYISSNQRIAFYYTSKEYPREAGKVIFGFGSSESITAGRKTPIRRLIAIALYDNNDYEILHDTGPIIDPYLNVGMCVILSKPENCRYIRVFIQENNPEEARAAVYANLSCLLTNDNDLFQVNIPNSIYGSRIYSIGTSVGITDFYASIYMANDLFVGCFGNENLIPDINKDLPKARFVVKEAIPRQVVDENGRITIVYDDGNTLVDMTLDASVELGNIPLRAEDLNNNNTFVDRFTSFTKKQNVEYVKVEVFYTRNTVFRYTMGCPRGCVIGRRASERLRRFSCRPSRIAQPLYITLDQSSTIEDYLRCDIILDYFSNTCPPYQYLPVEKIREYLDYGGVYMTNCEWDNFLGPDDPRTEDNACDPYGSQFNNHMDAIGSNLRRGFGTVSLSRQYLNEDKTIFHGCVLQGSASSEIINGIPLAMGDSNNARAGYYFDKLTEDSYVVCAGEYVSNGIVIAWGDSDTLITPPNGCRNEDWTIGDFANNICDNPIELLLEPKQGNPLP